MKAICPCCKRAIAAPKSTNSADKKLAQDVAKAQDAIEILLHYVGDMRESASMREACASEITRLSSAIKNPRKLWFIYRRRDKGPGYFVEEQEAIAA